MSFFLKSKMIAGIEITPLSFKIAVLKKRGKRWTTVKLEEVPLDTNPLEKIPKGCFVVTALPSREVLVRPLELPLKKEREIASAYPYQAEPLLPYPLDKAVLQKINVKSYADGTLLTLLAAKKDHVQRHLSFLKERGCSPDAVTCIPYALASLAGQFATSEELQIWITLNKNEGTLALVEKGKLLTARALENDPHEIQKSVLSALSTYKSRKVGALYLIADDPEAAKRVEEATQKTILSPLTPFCEEEEMQNYGVAIALALSCEKDFPHFLSKEQQFAVHLKRSKKTLALYFSLALTLFVTLGALERHALSLQEKRLLQQATSLFPEGATSLGELQEKLEKCQRELGAIPDTFPLYAQTPKVRDLLAYFSTDPRLFGNREAIQLEEMHYTLVTRPDFDKREEKYLVKVEMTLSSSTAQAAHAFHEALLSSCPFIDTKKEVEWGAFQGKYKTSFYLKDKTRYS